VITVCGEIDFGDGLENPVTQVLPEGIPVQLQDHPRLSALVALLFDEAFTPECGRQAAFTRAFIAGFGLPPTAWLKEIAQRPALQEA